MHIISNIIYTDVETIGTRLQELVLTACDGTTVLDIYNRIDSGRNEFFVSERHGESR